jgi:ribonuclease R
VGERSGRSFQLGSALRVLVAAVNLDERKIDLEPVALPDKGRQKRPAGEGAGRGKRGGAGRRKDSAPGGSRESKGRSRGARRRR